MTPDDSFRCEVEELKDPDKQGNPVTMVRCHGRLAIGSTDQIKDLVKPLISDGGHIVIDLSDVKYLDSSGLGTLVAFKVSAIRQGSCVLEFTKITPRVLELLHLTGLAELFSLEEAVSAHTPWRT
jgi:anti-anti-sigma factor